MTVSLPTLATLVLILLKLISVEPVASWSWWWVVSPSLASIALCIVLFGFAGFIRHLADTRRL
jgi:small Trp-rich protein